MQEMETRTIEGASSYDEGGDEGIERVREILFGSQVRELTREIKAIQLQMRQLENQIRETRGECLNEIRRATESTSHDLSDVRDAILQKVEGLQRAKVDIHALSTMLHDLASRLSSDPATRP